MRQKCVIFQQYVPFKFEPEPLKITIVCFLIGAYFSGDKGINCGGHYGIIEYPDRTVGAVQLNCLRTLD